MGCIFILPRAWASYQIPDGSLRVWHRDFAVLDRNGFLNLTSVNAHSHECVIFFSFVFSLLLFHFHLLLGVSPNILCQCVLWFAFIVLYKFTFSLDLEASQDLSLAVFHHCCKQMFLYAIPYHIIMLLSTRSSFLRLFVMNLLYSRLQ